jgi:glycosyltransferase involved in cell wall biosynthesis
MTGEDIRISVIIPTPGRRATLGRAIASATSQMNSGDELLVVFDNSGDWGITPRNRALAAATGTHISFLDDDDVYLPGALDAIRAFARKHPGRIGLFQMKRALYGTVWIEPDPDLMNTASGMFVVPNLPGKVGRYGPVPIDHDDRRPADHYPHYEGAAVRSFGPRSERLADYRFIIETVALQEDPIWIPHVLQDVRPEQSFLRRIRYQLKLRTRAKRTLGLPAPDPAGPVPSYPAAVRWARDHIRTARAARAPGGMRIS